MSKTRTGAALLGAALLWAGASQAAAPVARVTAPRTSCVAPCAIFFDARGTTDNDAGDHADELLDLVYTWNFGDPTSGTWSEGARAATGLPHSKNVDTGFIAGHVYERPGNYTATVTVSDGTSTSQDSILVSIQDPDQVFAGSNTVCIASNTTPSPGSGGCPSGAAVYRGSNFSTALTSNGCHERSRRCLFRRGDTFTATFDVRMTTPGPTLIGAYGSGAKPRVQGQPDVAVFRFDPGNSDIRIMDLHMQGNGGQEFSGGLPMIIGWNGAQIRRLLVLRVDIRNYDDGIHFTGPNSLYTPGVNVPREIAIVDSTILDGPGLGGIDFYVIWEQGLLLGNRIGDKFDGGNGRISHIVRAKYSDAVVYGHNSIGLLNNSGGRVGCGPSRHVMKMVSGLATDHYPAGVSREHIIADNYISSCRMNQWDIDLGRTDEQKLYEGQQRIIVERNFFTKRFSQRASVSLNSEGEEAAIRNNVFDLSGSGQSTTSRGLHLWNRAASSSPPVPTRDVRVYNNSCYRDAAITPHPAICIEVGSEVRNAIVRNNILFDSSGASDVLANSGQGTTTCSNCNRLFTATPYVSSRPANPSDYAPRSGGPAVDAGEAVPAVPINFAGTAAPLDGNDDGSARIDLGAWELDGAPGGPGGQAPAPPVLLP